MSRRDPASPGPGFFRSFLARRLPGVEVEIAYPTYSFAGVLCTHGHYLDPHARLSGSRGDRMLTRTLWAIATGGPGGPEDDRGLRVDDHAADRVALHRRADAARHPRPAERLPRRAAGGPGRSRPSACRCAAPSGSLPSCASAASATATTAPCPARSTSTRSSARRPSASAASSRRRRRPGRARPTRRPR